MAAETTPGEVKCTGVTYESATSPFTGEVMHYTMWWYTLKAGVSYTVFYSRDQIKWVGGMIFTARTQDHSHPEIVNAEMPMWPKIVKN
jgi:hypothetical protein